MKRLNLKEDSAIVLEDGFKYWIVKKVVIEEFDFYYTIKLSDPAEAIVFVDRDGLEVVDDEEILMQVHTVALDNIVKK